MKLSRLKRKHKRVISAGKIAEQFWCERRVELKLLYGIKPSGALLQRGKRIHDEISGKANLPRPENFVDWLGGQIHFTNISIDNFLTSGVGREIFLVAKVDGDGWRWYISGSIDEIRERRGRTQVVERKTRVKESIPANNSHRVQGLLYHLLLDEARKQKVSRNVRKAYDLGERAIISREYSQLAGIGERSVRALLKTLDSKVSQIPELDEEVVIVYESQKSGDKIGEVKFRARKEEIEKILQFSREYWAGEREALKTKDKWKCKFCEVRMYCF
ncbi:PD-(D/E)XK nuclease family protein [Archaeoglobus sp.]